MREVYDGIGINLEGIISLDIFTYSLSEGAYSVDLISWPAIS